MSPCVGVGVCVCAFVSVTCASDVQGYVSGCMVTLYVIRSNMQHLKLSVVRILDRLGSLRIVLCTVICEIASMHVLYVLSSMRFSSAGYGIFASQP